MAEIWLWNSIPTRKRAPSDGFLENGLSILKGYVEERGHKARVIDWQKSSFYGSLCFRWLLAINRLSTILIFRLARKGRSFAKAYFPVFNLIQEAVSYVNKKSMSKHLEKLADEAVNAGVKIFGIKVWYGEAFEWADWLTKRLKEKDPSILVIAGGFHTTLYEDDLLRESSFDLGVVSEGERALEIILDIADKHINNWDKDRALEDVRKEINENRLKNVVYRDGKDIKLTDRYSQELHNKTFPKYNKEDIEGKLRVHILIDSVGCPWGRCNFCTHWHIHPNFTPRPIDDIVSEIEYMLKKGVGVFRFAGSETPPGFGARIAKAILNKDLKIKYAIGCRAIKGITSDEERYEMVVSEFEVMLQSGLCGIFMGGESGNDIINDKMMNKGINCAEIIETARAYREAQEKTGISAFFGLALIYPHPLVDGITFEQAFNDDLNLIKALNPDSVIVTPSSPFKNSVWYREKEKFHFDIPDDYIKRMIRYEYVLYKPPSLWPSLGDVSAQGVGFKQALLMCEGLRKAIEKIGIQTDLTDDCFLLMQAAGYLGKEGMARFKRETSVDLVSADYRNIDQIAEQLNEYSKTLAESNYSLNDGF
ncbi:MAG: radical SAM protein [Candidatus Omnitrophota bacterium]